MSVSVQSSRGVWVAAVLLWFGACTVEGTLGSHDPTTGSEPSGSTLTTSATLGESATSGTGSDTTGHPGLGTAHASTGAHTTGGDFDTTVAHTGTSEGMVPAQCAGLPLGTACEECTAIQCCDVYFECHNTEFCVCLIEFPDCSTAQNHAECHASCGGVVDELHLNVEQCQQELCEAQCL